MDYEKILEPIVNDRENIECDGEYVFVEYSPSVEWNNGKIHSEVYSIFAYLYRKIDDYNDEKIDKIAEQFGLDVTQLRTCCE